AEMDARLKAKETPVNCADRAMVLMIMGRLKEALEGYERAYQLEQLHLKGRAKSYLLHNATVHWLLGSRQGAIDAIRRAVDGILDKSIGYADIAGGVSQGLLLWYFGVTANDVKACDDACAYLSMLAKGPNAYYWPGPLAKFVIGEMALEETLERAAGSRSLAVCSTNASNSVLKRRQLCQCLFYNAVRRRASGDEKGCFDYMSRTFELENPLIELEWYLARAEVQS
ncbi:MAG: hypothetical protein ACREEE_18520, partial [Dongiaceae bacterium]